RCRRRFSDLLGVGELVAHGVSLSYCCSCGQLLLWAVPPGILARHVLGYLTRKGRRALLDKRLDAFADVGMAAALDRHRLVDIEQLERTRRAGESPQHLPRQRNRDRG